MTSRVELEYDGSGFAGWARQPGLRTVEGELLRALGTLLPAPIELVVAGRTDAGVHARGQVVSYTGPLVPVAALNAVLPADVAVHSCVVAPEGFDARSDAVSRTYCYRVLLRRERSAFARRDELWWPGRIDRGRLHECAALVSGLHDFTAFTPADTTYRHFRRTVLDARWEEDGDRLAFWIEADSFLRHMNRALVGTMLQVAGSKRSLSDFAALLSGALRAHSGPTLPPRGLCLERVRYEPAVTNAGAATGSIPAT